MATTPTNKPVPSEDPRDLKFNAGKMDEAVNSTSLSYTDRLGKQRKTWSGIEADTASKLSEIDNIITSLDTASFTFNSIAEGIAGTTNGQYFRVPQGVSNKTSFIYYRNNNGSATPVANLVGMEAVKNLLPLNDSTVFSSGEVGSEFELNSKPWVVTDEDGYILFDVEEYINEKLKDMERSNVKLLTDTTEISSGGDEFELNPKVWVVYDDEYNIIFDAGDYNERSRGWDEAYEKSKNVEPQKTNPLAPFTQIDTSGKSQVRVINTDNNKETAVTNGSSNETDVRPDALDRIVWRSDRADNAPGGLFYAAYPDFREHSYIARSKIAGWGHSFMDNAAFLNKLAALTGLTTYNFGKSSMRSTGIAARQGGDPTFYMPVGGVIPASGTVNLTPNVAGPAANFGNTALSVPPSVLAGVEGTFTWDGSQASFTRTTSGAAVNVPEPVALYVRPFTTRGVTNSSAGDVEVPLNDEFINIFWLGRNNINQTETIIKNAIGMVNYLKNIGKRVVILPDFNSGLEPAGSTGYVQMSALNAALKSEFPEFYCEISGVDLRANFIAHGNPAYENDATLMAQDATPTTLRYDYLHPAQTLTAGASGVSLAPEYALGVGAEINAEFVYNFMKLKGWVL